MPQSLALVLVHLIFSTKNRQPFLHSPQLRADLHSYLAGSLRLLECEPFKIGGTHDHVHILVGLSLNTSLAELVKNLKTGSSRAFKLKGPANFAWQTGYGVFSVSESSKEAVVAYIANQERHHRKMTFQDEFRSFSRSVRWFDERYFWDQGSLSKFLASLQGGSLGGTGFLGLKPRAEVSSPIGAKGSPAHFWFGPHSNPLAAACGASHRGKKPSAHERGRIVRCKIEHFRDLQLLPCKAHRWTGLGFLRLKPQALVSSPLRQKNDQKVKPARWDEQLFRSHQQPPAAQSRTR
jgi:putative transposase